MSKFKVGDIIKSKRGYTASILEVLPTTYKLKLVKNWNTYNEGFTWFFDGSSTDLTLVNRKTKQQKIIDKIQWLYKNSPSFFEKRWVKNES